MTTTRDMDGLFSREQDAIAAAENYVDVARKLLEAEFDSDSITRRRRRIPMVVTAAVGIAAACALFIAILPNELSVTIEGENSELQAGSWVSSPKGSALQLSFSDGSTVGLSERSEVRVQSLMREGAHLLLERGDMDVSVVHRKETSWKIDAGPYQIWVTGTKFNVRWIPEKRALLLDMEDGSVRLRGPMLEGGKSLMSGETLLASLAESTVEVSRTGTQGKIITRLEREQDVESNPREEEASDPLDDLSDVESAETSQESYTDHLRRSVRGRKRGRAVSRDEDVLSEPTGGSSPLYVESYTPPREEVQLSWKALAREGKYHAAVALAEDAGFDRLIVTGTVSDLMLLADAARLASNPFDAQKAYRAVRKRFPGTRQSERAAFALGRVEFESEGNYAAAARWFEICYRENKSGPMAREAAGRLIEALNRAGEEKRAAIASKEYLTHFAQGPHANLAKKTLANSEMSE